MSGDVQILMPRFSLPGATILESPAERDGCFFNGSCCAVIQPYATAAGSGRPKKGFPLS
jgi:hypothetical protein